MKTAAVYDRWLHTLGGGEQVAFGFAQMLRDLGYKTSILTHKEIDKKKAESKLRVNLQGIELRYLPPSGSKELSQYTEQYDVFINTSYLDYFPNRSKLGILSVFFPGKIFLTPYEYFKRAHIVPSFKKLFIYPINFEGFLYDECKEGRIYKWMGSTSRIYFNQNISNLEIVLYFQTLAFSTLERMQFYIDEKQIYPISKNLSHTRNNLALSFSFTNTKGKHFTIKLPTDDYTDKVALLRLKIKGPQFILYNWFKQFFPTWEMRLHGGPGITKLSDLESYQKIVTISEFSRKWIKKYWGLDSISLYPSTDTTLFREAKRKKNWIIHVGRFFVTGHNKKQLDLVKAFTRMISAEKITDWELHFVGSVHEGEQHQQYYNNVLHQAQGYPVHFHTDITFEELKTLLAQSKIYWHATGLDENEEVQPILFEHFGITTVEAMASGCVPVVINGGGQKEIVNPGSGMLWNTREELISKTLTLIRNPQILSDMKKKAIARSKYFDRKKGIERFKKILSQE